MTKKGDQNDAQSCFERAIEIARTQSAKSLELQATTSLARLLCNTARRDEARAMLAHRGPGHARAQRRKSSAR
jgi:hypothetical protein